MKVTIDGQVYEWDGSRGPTSEALWIEHVYKRNYGQWQQDIAEGSARAFIMLACLIWRREGRNVDTAFADVIEGRAEFDIDEMVRSMAESAMAEEAAAKKAQAGEDPTIPGGSSGPDGSPGTGTAISPSSPASSGSARGKSASSKSRTSKR